MQDLVSRSGVDAFVRQRNEAVEIASRILRFKSKIVRGVGYSSLSVSILLQLLFYELLQSLVLLIPLVAAGAVTVWIIEWKTGVRDISRMYQGVYLLTGRESRGRFVLPVYVMWGILLTSTWIFYIGLEVARYFQIANIIPFIFSAEMILSFIPRSNRRTGLLLDTKMEDWVFLVAFVAAAISVVVPEVGALGFAFAVPLFMAVGIKMLYSAPMEMIANTMGIGEDESSTSDAESVQKLSSMGPLSNSARVGILVVLLGPKKATFTDLRLAVKLPKSSLNMSLSILQEADYVKVSTVFTKSGRHRTIVQITVNGEKAIREYAEYMNRITISVLKGQESVSPSK